MSDNSKDIILIKQLPVIEEQFLALEKQIKEKLSIIGELDISEEKKTEVKRIRAEFNKDSAYYSEQLKKVKDQITAPYIAIENMFKEHIAKPYSEADAFLKKEIDNIESEQKKRIYTALIAYFHEYKKNLGLTFPSYEKANFKVGVSSTLKSLKDQAKKFLDNVYDSMQTIQTLTYSDEVMVEYKTSLNLTDAIQIVDLRHKRLEEAAREKEQLSILAAQNAETESKVEEAIVRAEGEISAPAVECVQSDEPNPAEENLRIVRFSAEGTLEQLKRFKQRIMQYALEEGVKLT